MAIYKNTPPIVTNGLVLHLDAGSRMSYPGSGTTWTDLSGRGNHGTLINSPTFSSANQGSIVLNGTNQYISGNITTFTGNAAYTSVTWAKLNSVTAEQHLTNLKGDTTNNGVQFWVAGGTTGASSYGTVSGGTVIANNWYMFTQTKDTSNNGIHYINGIAVATGSLPTYGTATQYYVGEYVFGGSYYLGGNVSISMIYNRALSAQEVAQNYNALKSRFGLT